MNVSRIERQKGGQIDRQTVGQISKRKTDGEMIIMCQPGYAGL